MVIAERLHNVQGGSKNGLFFRVVNFATFTRGKMCNAHSFQILSCYMFELTRGSAMSEGPCDALVSRNSATTKHPI